MKFHPDAINAASIQSYGPDWVEIANNKLTSSFVLASTGELYDWHCQQFEDLTHAHFEQLVRLQPELVIFGSGKRLRFPSPVLTAALIDQQIGVETMDLQAACRTYNVLAGEGRKVVLALLIDERNKTV